MSSALGWRLLLGSLLIALVAGLCWLDFHAARPGTWLFPLALAIAVLAAGEMVALTAGGLDRSGAWIVYLGTVLIVASNGLPMFWENHPVVRPLSPLGWPSAALAVGVLLALVGAIRGYDAPGRSSARVAVAVFAMVYVGLLLSFTVQLRMLGGGRAGLVALVSMIVAVKMSDIGAYTVGRLIGRHKMAPRLSPGKTWEGAAGGILFACIGSLLVFTLLAPRFGLTDLAAWWNWVLYGSVIGVAGIFGDLAESLLKRDAGRKDSSQWMPGFGGVLDLLDSILAASPVAYLFWIWKLA